MWEEHKLRWDNQPSTTFFLDKEDAAKVRALVEQRTDIKLLRIFKTLFAIDLLGAVVMEINLKGPWALKVDDVIMQFQLKDEMFHLVMFEPLRVMTQFSYEEVQ